MAMIGVFAIAFATVLCHGQVPEEEFSDVTQLRQHLQTALTENTGSHFQLEEGSAKRRQKMQATDRHS